LTDSDFQFRESGPCVRNFEHAKKVAELSNGLVDELINNGLGA